MMNYKPGPMPSQRPPGMAYTTPAPQPAPRPMPPQQMQPPPQMQQPMPGQMQPGMMPNALRMPGMNYQPGPMPAQRPQMQRPMNALAAYGMRRG